MSGFAVGFFLGGLLGIPLLALLGSTEQLMLATTAADSRVPRPADRHRAAVPGGARGARPGDGPVVARPPLRTLFAPGSSCCCSSTRSCRRWARRSSTSSSSTAPQAQYSGDELTRFLSAYTAVLNLVDILFLALLAGPLMRRFGLRLGLVFNPAVVAVVLAVMTVIVAAGPRQRLGALRAGRRASRRRHRRNRRHDPHVDQRRVPGRPDRRTARGAGGRRGSRRARRDRCDRVSSSSG